MRRLFRFVDGGNVQRVERDHDRHSRRARRPYLFREERPLLPSSCCGRLRGPFTAGAVAPLAAQPLVKSAVCVSARSVGSPDANAPRNGRHAHAVASTALPARVNVTVCGSFNRHLAEIQHAVEALGRAGAAVLSPLDPQPRERQGPFLFLAGDSRRSVKGTENRHLDAIAASSFVWLECPTATSAGPQRSSSDTRQRAGCRCPRREPPGI